MRQQQIAIIDYGAGNTRSVGFALERLGVDYVLTDNAEVIRRADKVIFPGVGEAGSAMRKLKERNLHRIIPDLKQPVLGICLGMQLMCTHSEEGDTIGLSILPIPVKRFNSDLKVPHMGWNRLGDLKGKLFTGIQAGSYAYFVHSFYVPMNSYMAATTSYGLSFSAALQVNNFYAVQFHPEKSGDTGQTILRNFIQIEGGEVTKMN